MLKRTWTALRLGVALLFVIAACIAGLPFPGRRSRIASRAAATQRLPAHRRTVESRALASGRVVAFSVADSSQLYGPDSSSLVGAARGHGDWSRRLASARRVESWRGS